MGQKDEKINFWDHDAEVRFGLRRRGRRVILGPFGRVGLVRTVIEKTNKKVKMYPLLSLSLCFKSLSETLTSIACWLSDITLSTYCSRPFSRSSLRSGVDMSKFGRFTVQIYHIIIREHCFYAGATADKVNT